MATSFQRVSLSDCLDIIIDNRGVTPHKRNTEWKNTGIPVLSANNVKTSGLEKLDDIRFLDESIYESWMKYPLERGDILLTSEAPAGEVMYWDSDQKVVVGQRLYGLKVKKSINSLYLKYYLQSETGQNEIKKYCSGSTVFGISAKTFGHITVLLPEKSYQDNVSKILYSLDKKIENNNKIIDELDNLAKLLYERWFLQFDFPNTENLPYKFSGGEMVYSEIAKRKIPENWRTAKIKDIISHINTGLNPRQNFVLNNGNIKYVTVKNLTTKGTIDFTTCDTIDKSALKKVHKRSDISKGDILFASIAPLGRCVIIREDPMGWDINESVFSIRPKSKNLSEYLYMFFMSEYFIRKAEHSSTGSVFSGIRISVLEDMEIVVPPENVLDEFSKTISPILDLKYQNEIENQKLKEIRDFLLPLLMNGQARIIE